MGMVWGGVVVSGVLRVSCRREGAGFAVRLTLEGAGAPRAAQAQFGLTLSAQDREDVRWYLEDYLQYPVAPAPQIAARVEDRLAGLGTDLFRQVFEANRDAIRVWDAVAGSLPETRVEVDAGIEAGSAVPWELLRDPVTDGVLALRAGAFVRTHPGAAVPPGLPEPRAGGLRVLLVICRPGGAEDVPFRSVASHLVRLSRGAREAFRLDVLRPPTFGQLARALEAARVAGDPYQVVHFDGHGTWLDEQTVAAAAAGEVPGGGFSRELFSLVSPSRPGSHGFLVFEDPDTAGGRQLVDGPALGGLLADAGVGVLLLNACRSAHADLATEPETGDRAGDAHRRVRAYGSLAQEVMDAGVAGVVAMRYNVYVVTAAVFVGEVYTALLAGQPLGGAVTAARRQLAASPQREVGGRPVPLQDWVVPVVYEAVPLVLQPPREGEQEFSVGLSQGEAGRERAALETGLPSGPDVGFFGRDETLLALDRAFDDARIVLLHAWAGAGKTSTAAEFARWYALTAGTGGVLFTSFEHHLVLARLLDQVGDRFGSALERSGVQWAALDDGQRREVAVRVLAQVPVLWVWDNIEPVAGFPAGTPSAWTKAEQDELVTFLRDLGQYTQCKVLLTSRREERAWLGDLPARVALPAMPMLERLELAQAVVRRQTGSARAFLQVEDWRPLLAFTQGNPLTVTVLARQAIRGHHVTREQIEGFVRQLRVGSAAVTDDAAQGRDASLAASLDYGFTQAFTDDERAVLALLALFQGFVDVDALVWMGNPDLVGGPVPAVAGLDREAGIGLLDRAAEVGLLTSYGGGFYAVHPAVPWHLHTLFEQHYGPDDNPTADRAVRAWTDATRELGNYYYGQYNTGHTDVIGFLGAEEANLLRARHLALTEGWHDLVIGPMQGLRALYEHTGRAVEWRRLVEELVPEITDSATGGPLPGREQHWTMLTSYRVLIARDARDWPAARQLQDAAITFDRQQVAAALATPPAELDDRQRNQIRNLAVDLFDLGKILRDQDDPGCVQPYTEAMELYQRIGHRHGEGAVASELGHAYKDIPALRDLDQAEHWYQRDLELVEEHDTLGHARNAVRLGNIAYERFDDAFDAGAPEEELLGYLNDAAGAYYRALELTPDDAADDLAVAHGVLGNVYHRAGQVGQALAHYVKSIQYDERQDNRYRAGGTRLNAAIALAGAGRRHDALLYARAALRDLEALGFGAVPAADGARQLITELGQEAAHEPDSATDDGA
jgi:tetratricopeptide (TPR) repeat protein